MKLVSFHIQAHLNAFLQILEYFSQICLGHLARESPCTADHKEGEQLEDRRNVGESSCNFGDGTAQRVQYLMFMVVMMVVFPTFHACSIHFPYSAFRPPKINSPMCPALITFPGFPPTNGWREIPFRNKCSGVGFPRVPGFLYQYIPHFRAVQRNKSHQHALYTPLCLQDCLTVWRRDRRFELRNYAVGQDINVVTRLYN